MPKTFRKMTAFLCCLLMLFSLMQVSFANEADNENAEQNETPTAIFGTPQLGSNDPLWSKTMEHQINKSKTIVPDETRPHATGTARILWDNDYVYARVVVEDSNLYQGRGGDHTYDSLEFYVGTGSSGSNQWRVSSTGVFSGQSHTDRDAWTEITDTGYIVEMRIPKRTVPLQLGKLTFEVYINNSTEEGADRYEVVSAFGSPDTGYTNHNAFLDSLVLIEAPEVDNRHSITLSAATGGTIIPNAPGNVLRVESGSGKTFNIIPDNGKVVDNVTVNGEAVTLSEDGTFSLSEIDSDQSIQVTFKNDDSANQLPFIVWNDNFASGEYTTAVIIDLGEGKEALGSELKPDMFTVSARNTTLVDDLVTFEGVRDIARVYATDEPKVRGYIGDVYNSPGYQPGLDSGRYIVIELDFYTKVGGNTTLDGSNSTKQNYNVVQNGVIPLADGDSLNNVVFTQENVVNPILDKFTTHTYQSANYALYIHKDANGEAIEGLPLYVYTHGFSRGGTQAHIDQKASMKSANGAVALMKKMEQDSSKYASHVLNISYSGASSPQPADVKAIIDDLVANGLVNADRIYASGFSMGAMFTHTLVNNNPGFFAAAAPLGLANGNPSAITEEAHKDLAYWIFVNAYDTRVGAAQLDTFINNNLNDLTNARASRFDSNEALTWPYNQYDQPSQKPNLNNNPPLLEYIAHEVEAAVLYNKITMENPLSGQTWSIAPIAQSPSLPDWNNQYTDIFDWMFVQSKAGIIEPEVPSEPTAMFGTPQLGSNDPLWNQTMEHAINKSTVPADPRPHATGTARILWDNDYIYARVVVEDSNLYQGRGADYTYDSLEFYVGSGSNGSNQWRISSTGVFSGQSHTDRAAWTEITDTGYIVEMRIPKRNLTLQPGKFTFEVYINNSTETGSDRYEVVSAFGTPDTGYGSHNAFENSIELIPAHITDTRHAINISSGTGGKITPNAPGNVLKVESGSSKTFNIIADTGKIVESVKVNGVSVDLTGNTLTLSDINADQTIEVTFVDDPAATQLPFIVWNDNFASGEYTTAVIIDLGEGNEALGSELKPDMFTVSARNTTLVDELVAFEGVRNISRVYANDEPKVRGYAGKVFNSPDYQPGLDSGRYIVVELEFYTEVGGSTTLNGSNSTQQIYNIVQKGNIVLTEGDPISYAVFKQNKVVNPILDKFTTHFTDSVNRALYLQKDEDGEVVQGLPLYIYTHGGGRGGSQANIDPKAAMKSANGAVALMKKMEENPTKYTSHVLNISYSGFPSTSNVKKVIDDLIATGAVNPDRIYAAGFSLGGMFTNNLINAYPGFFAAAAPMAPVNGSPNASTDEAHADTAYWMFNNVNNVGTYQTNHNNFVNNNMPYMTNARASNFESNEALTWPYNQFDQPSQRPNPSNTPVIQDYIAHEVEAAVLYNKITMDNPFTNTTWTIAPVAQSANLPAWNNQYTDVFDWMFSQSKAGIIEPEVPSEPTAMFGTPQLGSNDPLWNQTMEHAINKSTVPEDPRPHATGKARILWDNDYIYARVVVEDSDVYQGSGGDHTYDSLEFFVGSGSSGSNQWRVSSTGVFSGQSHTDRAAWTQITDTGYIVEVRIPKRSLTLEPGKFTFEVNINNSTKNGADRYEVVSAFGTPDTGFNSDAAFRNSLELITANQADTRHSVTLSVATGGKVTPNAPGNVLRIAPGLGITFTITPDTGKIVDTVTVNGQAVAVTDNTFSVQNITAGQKINVTFKDDSAAEQLPFIVWNDNFASGEYTTAVIIDLGEGNEAIGSELNSDLFTISARNTTLVDDLVAFEGTRNIARVYANDEPKVRGYSGKVHNSPDYQPGLESGRYIIIELEFYTEVGGNTTLTGSNSTKQNYNIVLKDNIVLAEGDPIDYAVFKQDKVVNPILDKFTAHTSDAEVNYALYIHKDENGDVIEGLPLYVYTHGFSRGGTQAHIDQKASMKSANGAVALMKRMEQNPAKYASHVLNISYSGGNAPQVGNIKKIIDELVAEGLVNGDRIYASGFSMGGGVTTNLIGNFPGFFAAAAPLGISSGWPSVSADEAHKDLAYWIFVNTYDSGASNIDNAAEGFKELTNARASRFDSNESLSWPYNQYDQPSQRPNLDNDPPLQRYIAHEVEAAVLYNKITMTNPLNGNTWSIAPIAQSPSLPAWNNDYTDVFDWMFSQSKAGIIKEPGAPTDLKAAAGDRQVKLSWTAPTNNGGSAILGYKVWFGNETPVTLGADKTKHTFTNLTNGQSYTFKVVAVNAQGVSAEVSATATPNETTTPIVTNPTNPSGGGNTSTETDVKPTYKVNTPQDKPAVTDQDGKTTLPGGGEIVTVGGTKINVPKGTTIDSKGKVVVGSGDASISLENGGSLNIREGAELMLNDNTILGFIVVSGNPFKDVNDDNWFYSYVNSVYTFGLFNGTMSTSFSPGNSMTRAMFVQALANLENIDRSEYTSSRFSDVADGQWYTAAVEWATESGIVSGINAEQFDPNSPLTREQLLVILYNYMKYKGYDIPQKQVQSFADERAISSWALKAVQALQGIDIVKGKGNNIFDPKGTATRAEVAAVLVRFIEYLAK